MGHFKNRIRSLVLGALAATSLGTAACETADGEDAMADSDVGEAELAEVSSCADILGDGVFDTYEETYSAESHYALAKAFCNDVKTGKSGGGGISAKIFDWVGISLTGSGETSAWQKYCEKMSTSSDSTETSNLLTRVANGDIVEAWKQCMTNAGGLACDFKPGENIVDVRYREIANSGRLKNVTVTKTNMTVQNQSVVSPALYIGDSALMFSIPDPKKDASVVINGRTMLGNYAQSCKVYIKNKYAKNAEAKAMWNYIKSELTKVRDAVNSIPEDPAHSKQFMVNPLVAATQRKINAAIAGANNCSSNLSTCTPPKASDYKVNYSITPFKCLVLFNWSHFYANGSDSYYSILQTTPGDMKLRVGYQVQAATAVGYSKCVGL